MGNRNKQFLVPLFLSLLVHLLALAVFSLEIFWPKDVSARRRYPVRIVSLDQPKPEKELSPDELSRFLSDANRRESGSGKPSKKPRLRREKEDVLPSRRGAPPPLLNERFASLQPAPPREFHVRPPSSAIPLPPPAPPAASRPEPKPEGAPPPPSEAPERRPSEIRPKKEAKTEIKKKGPKPEAPARRAAPPKPPAPEKPRVKEARKAAPPPPALTKRKPEAKKPPEPAPAPKTRTAKAPARPEPRKADRKKPAKVKRKPVKKKTVAKKPAKKKTVTKKPAKKKPVTKKRAKKKPVKRTVKKRPVRKEKKPEKRPQVASLPKVPPPRPEMKVPRPPRPRRKPPADPLAPFRNPNYKSSEGPEFKLSDEEAERIAKAARERELRKEEEGETVSLETRDYRYVSYFAHIKRRIYENWRWPYEARKYQGKMSMKFVLREDGSLYRIELLTSSGYRILDDEALSAVTKAAPFNPFPKGLNRRLLPIEATFIYQRVNSPFRR